MAEPGATILPPTAAPARDVLLATKLHIPRPRPGFLSRPRLLELLNDGATRELTLVCARAGFGKTTLLGDWARRSRRPVAWLSLDAGDNDPARFWRHVAAALDQVLPGAGERVAVLLRGGRSRRWSRSWSTPWPARPTSSPWSLTTTTGSRPRRSTRACGCCWTGCPPSCGSSWPARPAPRCPLPPFGPAGSWP